jgi:hypothetical protein
MFLKFICVDFYKGRLKIMLLKADRCSFLCNRYRQLYRTGVLSLVNTFDLDKGCCWSDRQT